MVIYNYPIALAPSPHLYNYTKQNILIISLTMTLCSYILRLDLEVMVPQATRAAEKGSLIFIV